MQALAIDPGLATVIGALLALVGILVQQRKTARKLISQQVSVHQDNRKDHAETSAKVDQLITATGLLGTKVEGIDTRLDIVHDDLKHVKHQLRDQSVRIHDLEMEV